MQPALDARSTRGADAPYELDVVDEAIVNGVAHRDYAISPARRFACSCLPAGPSSTAPAGCPNHYPLDEAPYRTFTRNQLLVGFLSRIRSKRTGQVFLETRGEGVRKILEDGEALPRRGGFGGVGAGGSLDSGRRPESALFGGELRLTCWAKGTRWSG